MIDRICEHMHFIQKCMTFVNLLKVKIVTALMLISILAVNFSFHNDTLYIDLVHECVKLLKPKNFVPF